MGTITIPVEDYELLNDRYRMSKERSMLSYVNSLNMVVLFCKKFRQVAIHMNDTSAKRYLSIINNFYFDDKGRIKWAIIQQVLPPDVESFFNNEYPMLSEREIRLCCLMAFDLPANDITGILAYSNQGSVHTITNRIKSKIGVKNVRESFKNLLLNSF